jgi:hypothetical protein
MQSGTVPRAMCSGPNSNITDLILASNQLGGSFVVDPCENLIQLDLSVRRGGIVHLVGIVHRRGA